MLLSLAALVLAAPGVTLVVGGDVIPHGPVKAAARAHARAGQDGGSLNDEGWGQVLGPLASVLRAHDVAIVNLETPLSPRPGRTKEMLFDAPPALAHALKRAGVTVASFANNHCLDQGPAGILSTRMALADAGLATVGAAGTAQDAWTPLVLEVKGMRLGLIAVSRWLNGFHNPPRADAPHVPVVAYRSEPVRGARSEAALAALVSATAARVDATLVLIHWGAEYSPAPAPEDVRLARALVEAGATAVVGHHPHVLQPVQWLSRADGGAGLVAYSLGNLVSNQDFATPLGPRRDGLLLALTLERGDGGVHLTEVHGVPLSTENRAGPRSRDVQVVLLSDELAAMEARLSALEARDDPAARGEKAALKKRRAVARARLARIIRVVGPSVVMPPVEVDPRRPARSARMSED